MTTKPKSVVAAPSRPARNPGFVIVDIVLAVVFAFVGFIFMFYLIAVVGRFPQPYKVLITISTVVSWAGGLSMFVLFLARRRMGFYWTLVGIVAMFAFYYLFLFIASRTVS